MTDLHRIIWLASFPKSGNTWMRSFLAHYMTPPGMAPDINNLKQFTTGDTRVDFYMAAAGGAFQGGLEEWLKVRPRALQMIAASKPNHHFVKTHCQAIRFMGTDLIPNDVTAAAIYIMRNPFDVVQSFSRHLSLDVDTTIDRMCDPDSIMATETGICEVLGRWDAHVASWTTAPGLAVHVVRYEDLIGSPPKTFSKMLEKFLRMKVDKPKLARAVKATSFGALKKQEEKLGFLEKPKGMQSFFSKGKAGAWKEELTKEQVARLREAFLPTLEKWYPELIEETARFLK